MRRTLLAFAVTAGAALAGAGIAVQPAAAASPASRLTLSVRAADGSIRIALLTCGPAGGTHQRAAAACAALATAGGDPAAIAPADSLCTMEYAPVTAKATGRWQGRVVRYRERFGNACLMRLETGALFPL